MNNKRHKLFQLYRTNNNNNNNTPTPPLNVNKIKKTKRQILFSRNRLVNKSSSATKQISNRLVNKSSSATKQNSHNSANQKHMATKKIQRFFKTTVNKRRLANKSSSASNSHNSATRKHRATQKIQRFFKTTTNKRVHVFLNKICSNTGVCLAIGRESEKIKKHFDFSSFKYTRGPLKKIGNPSANGFINEISYERNGYRAYCVLKSSADPLSDNLGYEYWSGMAINDFNQYCPSFIETYGLFRYTDSAVYNNILNNNNKKYEPSQLGLVQVNSLTVAESCNNPETLCLLIQHIENGKSMKNVVMSNVKSQPFIIHTLPTILYQIYATLAHLAFQYTHYDLHMDNIMLYQPDPNGYIEYIYHRAPGKIITFCSHYMVKLIDYGRCHFPSSAQIIKTVCANKNECGPDCGDTVGYSSINQRTPSDFYYIASKMHNCSIDLRPMSYLHTLFEPMNSFDKYPVIQLIKHIETLDPYRGSSSFANRSDYENMFDAEHYGRKQNVNSGYNLGDIIARNNYKINNVMDAEKCLSDIISADPTFGAFNGGMYSKRRKLGEMHIYMDSKQRASFIPTRS